MPKELILAPERERSLLRKHPWVFSGAVARILGDPAPGDTIEIYASDHTWLARGAYSPASQIRARVWTFNPEEAITPAFFTRRIQKALLYRQALALQKQTNAFRLVHGEADGLPGCVIDCYGDFCVCQFLSVGIEANRIHILNALKECLPGLHGIYERSDTDARTRDGLEPRCGLLYGMEPPEFFEVCENGIRFLADFRNGHKTGFYLDQRENRATMPFITPSSEVLNCFCYTGGFGLRAAKDGASHVTQLDISGPALEIARRNADLNGLPQEKFTYEKADVFLQLRKYRDSRRSFDTVILDPPKFADTQKQLEKACRGYKDINLLGVKLTRPGGTLLTFSCSGAMTPELFQKIVGDAARDAGRQALVVRTLSQASDHPLALDFPEGRYLTGLQVYLP